MEITSEGMTKYMFEDRLSDIVGKLQALLPSIDVSPASYLYQLLKVQVINEMNWQDTIEKLYYKLSPVTADGMWLRGHVQRTGMKLDRAKKARVWVWIQGVQMGIRIGTTASFSTDDSKNFVPITYLDIPTVFSNTRESGDEDDIPDHYRFYSIEKISASIDGTSEYTGWILNNESQVIDWSDATSPPAAGATYFIFPLGSIDAVIECESDTAGTDYNVGSGTITIPAGVSCDSCNNETQASGGSDIETDDELRARWNEHMFARFTKSELEDEINDVEGVKSCSINDVLAVDQKTPASWTTLPSSSMGTAWTELKQSFTPGDDIGFLNSINLSIAKLVEDPYSMELELQVGGTGLVSTSIEKGMVDEGCGTNYQPFAIDLRWPLDNSNTYDMVFSGSGGTHWNFARSDEAYSGGELEFNGNGTGFNLAFKTLFKTPAIKIVIDTEPDYEYEAIEDLIDVVVDDGYLMAGIDYAVSQATQSYFTFTCTVSATRGYTLATIEDNIDSVISTLLDLKKPGDTIYFNEIIASMMGISGIKTVRKLSIIKDGTEVSNEVTMKDVVLDDEEIPVFSEVTASIGFV
jgi:hypothetical protein